MLIELTKAWGDGLADGSYTQQRSVVAAADPESRFQILENDINKIKERLNSAGIP